jgi:Protein of unknown function (DUF2961)
MKRRELVLALALISVFGGGRLQGQSLYTLREGVETRWASPENPLGEKGKAAQSNAGRKGRPAIPVKAGEQVTLAEVHGASGTVRRFEATISDRSPAMLRGLKLEIFWDEAAKPAVSAPFGDFFGEGMGQMTAFDSALFSSPEGRSFNCFVPMPFRRGMKIVVTNESGKDLESLYYEIDYTLGDKHQENDLYFHAHFRREKPTQLQHDFEILPQISGKGRFLGEYMCIQADKKSYLYRWWGEGEVKVYLDGDRDWPTLAGTGSEDYVGTGWGIQSKFADLYQGSPLVDNGKMQYCLYRYHVPDPIFFNRDIRVTIQQIGYTGNEDSIYKTGAPIYQAGPGLMKAKKGWSGLFERQDDWSAVAYFYLDKPEDELPAIEAPEQRMKGLAVGAP